MTLAKAGDGSVPDEAFNAVVDAIGQGPPAHTVQAADIDSQAAADGTVLTADGAGGAAFEAGGGGSQPFAFTLIGPFRVNFDDADLVDLTNGMDLETIPADSMVLRAFALVETSWTPVNDGRYLEFGAGAPAGQFFGLFGESWIDDDNAAGSLGDFSASEFPKLVSLPTVVRDELSFKVRQQDVGISDPVETGAADVYAILASPA